ncbi:SWIM zinc finger family protein, partial [Angustibacter aerolatus]
MPRWTPAAVERAAPDAASLAAARRLARPGPWSATGSTDTLVWGSCQGSGSTPYRVSVDLAGPAYRCSCPSRKHPCKHSLALLLLWVQGSGSVADAERPADDAQQWALQRADRAAGTPAAPRAPVDPVAQEWRRDERLARMSAGLDDLGRWLTDLVRGGTVQARQQPFDWWDAAAARLVDAQLPGLADRLRSTGAALHGRPDWSDHLLSEVGLWWTAVRAWRRWDELPEPTRADLRAFVGWAQSSEEVRAGKTVDDTWLVLGAHRSDDGRLLQQRTWLRGTRSGEVVQLLDFAVGTATLPVAHLAGSALDAVLALYPGSRPRRALVVGEPVVRTGPVPEPDGGTVDDALRGLAATWADNPWAPRALTVL